MADQPEAPDAFARMNRARTAPHVTCPASRHAAKIADALWRSDRHDASSVAFTVTELWVARRRIKQLEDEVKAARRRIKQLEDEVKAARRKALEDAATAADQWATDEQRQFGNGGPAAYIRAMIEQGDGE